MDGVAQYVQPVPNAALQTCIPQVQDVPLTSWVIKSKPVNSSAAITQNGKFEAFLKLDVVGDYVVTFTACPATCNMIFPPNPTKIVPAQSQDVTLTAVDTLPLPPQQAPIVADLGLCKPQLPSFNVDSPFTDAFDPCKTTNYSDDHGENVCNGGGGVINPEWVTVYDWHGVNDYQAAEGQVDESHIAREDDNFAHSSQDVDLGVLLDQPYRYLISQPTQNSGNAGHLAMEWETGSWPEEFRPVPGDRVSVWGYWIHDCGHDYHTEIHPPVGAVTDKQQAILLPPSAGMGTNVYIPGIQSDVWFNAHGGLTTDDCGSATLHQPATDDDENCVPLGDSAHQGHTSPIKRSYSYNIYLPPSPETILKQAGKNDPPHIELYVAPSFDPSLPQPQIQFKQDAHGTGYLQVTIDLSNFNGTTYSGRIDAGWKYPAADNWGLKQYSFQLDKLDIRDDSDWTNETLGWGGDFHLWALLNNQTSWTKLMAGDDNEYDDNTDTFGGKPWSTRSQIAGRNLGSDLLMYPDKMIKFFLTGYEDDGIESSDQAGGIAALIPLPTQTRLYEQNNYCTDNEPEFQTGPDWLPNVDVVISGCTDYTAHFRVSPVGALTAQLSAEGQALSDAALVHSSDLNNCQKKLVPVLCWDDLTVLDGADWHPQGQHPTVPTDIGDFEVFAPQESESKAWDDIIPNDLKALLESTPPQKLDKWLTEVQAAIPLWLHNDHPAMEFVILEAALPPGKFEQYFGDVQFYWPVWGDINCDGATDSHDALKLLDALYVGGKADCLNVGDVDCKDDFNVLDVLAMMKFAAGLGATNHGNHCPLLGDDLHIMINNPPVSPTPSPTPTPTPTVTPSGTPTPTPTATPTATPTPAPSPSATPSPTPDSTGPTITNVVASPSGINPNFVYDHFDNSLCPVTVTTISANVSEPSGLNYVQLWARYYDGSNPPTGYTNVGPTFNGGTGKWEKAIDYPLDAIGPDPADIEYFWQAQDTNGNITVFPSVSYSSVPVVNCEGVIP